MIVGAKDVDNTSGRPVSVLRRVFVGSALGLLTLALGVSGLGMIPVPNLTGNATILHIPVILGGVFGGPVVGVAVGGVFGGFSWVDHSAPVFRDPLVAVLPRLLIGLVAWWVFAALRERGITLAAALSGALGSVSNSAGVVTVAVALGHLPPSVALDVLPQALLEAALAAAAVVFAVRGYLFYVSRRRGSAKGNPPT